MSLSFRDFLRFFIGYKEPGEDREIITKAIFAASMSKMMFIFAFFFGFQLVVFLASFTAKHATAGYIVSYRYVYLSEMLIMLIAFVLLLYIKRDFDRRYNLLKYMLPVLSIFVLIWTVAAMVVNTYAQGFVNPSLYIAISLLVPLYIYMSPVAYVIIAILCDTVMLMVYHSLNLRIASPSPEPAVIGVIHFLILSFALMIYFHQYFMRVNFVTFERQKREIDDLNNAQNRFFSSMSHEIRTPINTIVGFNEMILREPVSDEVAEDAANIKAASNMLLHLINDILDMGKIRSGQMKLTPVNYHPGDMITELVGMLWHRAKDKGLDLRVVMSQDIPAGLYADEVRIKQILINVLNNAIKYTEQGSVTFFVQCDGINDGKADIVYSVTDTGIGIRKESMPHLFTAFRRSDEEKNRYIEGTGLGLAIVKELTELMGGSVSVNSIYTQGSTFVIEIPQTVTDSAPTGDIGFEDKRRQNMAEMYKASFTAPGARVLVVDDNESNLLVVRKLLRDTQAVIDTALSGAQALELTLEREYDVIFLDHIMPDMDGIETFRRIRNQVGGASKEAMIVALTANAGGDVRKLYMDTGFDGYIGKPVNADELEAMLAKLLPKEKVVLAGDSDNIIENSMLWMNDRRKKRAVMITTESVADIPRVLMDKYGIAVIPHKVVTENGVFDDGVEIDSEGLLDYMTENTYIQTHAPSVEEHEEFFARALSGANNIIHMTVSRKVTHTGFSKASEGAAAFDNVTVFDTNHLSSGQGILVIEACRMADEGLSAGEIIANLSEMIQYVHTSFIVDNMDYLARSGQVGSSTATLFKAIMCHPVLKMSNGKISVNRFYFGTQLHAWKRYINSCLSNESEIDKRALYITYVGLGKKDIDLIKELVEKRVSFDNVYVQKAAPAIAVNCGPATFGLLFMKKRK